MLNWIKNIIAKRQSKRINKVRIREAYLMRDSRFLKKAYKRGEHYLKRTVVQYLGEFATQENFNFLIEEMKTVGDTKLKSYIFLSIMNIALNESIEISEPESEYLNQNLGLLENIGLIIDDPKKKSITPISFRDRLRDHIGMLEQIKKASEIF